MGERGCSDVFADAFIGSFGLPFVKDPTGSYTDSYSFFDSVPECVNLSVGYYDQHTKKETQDIVFLEQMATACIDLDWEALPAVRDPKTIVFDDQDWGRTWWKKPAVTKWDDMYDLLSEEFERLVDAFVAGGYTADQIRAFIDGTGHL